MYPVVGLTVLLFGLETVRCQELATQLLKDAADTLFLNPLLHQGSPVYSYVRAPEPSHLDLLVRRIQIGLDAQVEDNWRALNEPQRFAILREGDPVSKILRSFRKLKSQIETVEKNTEGSLVESQLNTLDIYPVEVMRVWIRYWDSIRKYVGQIGQFYSYFQRFVEDPEKTSLSSSLNDFASSMVESKTVESSLENMLRTFHGLVIRQNENSTLFSFLDQIFLENDEHLCSMSQSPYQLMYNLYNIIALTELKGYAMLQFSYMILRINKKGNFTVEAEAARKLFEAEATEKLVSVKEVLPGLSRAFRRCDPYTHVEDQTYLRVKGFMQGYIENEVDMNDRGTCKSKCSEYTYAESKGCYKDMFCAKQKRCAGRIFDCEFYNADAWVCMSQDPDRRYDSIEYEDGTILGQTGGQCINRIKVDSWWRWVFWHCSYCLCKCDEITAESERYWSLIPAEADVGAGFVVTGARFVKNQKIFHLQIEQAKALPEGGVDESTRAWKPVPTFSDTNLTLNTKEIYTMSYEQRAMDLDTLSAPEGHVLTGLKLRNIGGHLNLEIQVTPIKFTTAELMKDQSIWVANDNTPATTNPRKLLPIVIPDIPTRLIGQNKIDGFHDQYFQFDTSSAHKDVGQNTIPFLDAQPVSPSPATWLSGAGIYHKGRIGFGGFVGLAVETFDFSRHLLPGVEDVEVKVDFVKVEGV